MASELPAVSDIAGTLDGAASNIGLARACMWGAYQATAPADRWQRADDDLAAAAAAIETARAQLAAAEKLEAYCTACQVPLLSHSAGWKHWDGSKTYQADHEVCPARRPVGIAAAAAQGDVTCRDLAGFAAVVLGHLREHFTVTAERQVIMLCSEAGEAAGAYARFAGMSRRSGPLSDVAAELADVVITAYLTAEVLGIDLDAAWQAKAEVILARGWKETAGE